MQPQDFVLREFNYSAYDYIGLSSSWTDFRESTENREYITEFKALRTATNLHKYIDEPDDVRPQICTVWSELVWSNCHCFTSLCCV